MAYLAPIHRPSSVRDALKLHLLDPNEECLVLAKANRIEIWNRSEEGRLVKHSTKAIYGRVAMLAKIRPPGFNLDLLFIGTNRFQYFTVGWNEDTHELETAQTYVDMSEKHMRDSQSRDLCLVDPTGKYLVLELFEGVLSLVRILKTRKGREEHLEAPQQVRIAELRVRATTFLYTETKQPKIAFLYENGAGGDLRLSTYRLVDEKLQYALFDSTKDRENDIGKLCMGSSHLIPVRRAEGVPKRYMVRNDRAVRAQLGGVIVVGETKMTYLDDESKAIVECALDEASIFLAWERYDDLRYLLADEYGFLHLMTLVVEDADVMSIDVTKIGKITKATALVYLGDGELFIGSHEGDSQLVLLDLDSETEKVSLLQTMVNIAPILDFAVMDMGSREGESQSNEYSSGQARLVTGSGGYQEGSVRDVRSGVGLEDLAILPEMEDIQAVYALQSGEKSQGEDTIVVSFPTDTRVFSFDSNGEVEEVDSFRGLSLTSPTLIAMNLADGLILQVTEKEVLILGPGPSHVASQWRPPANNIITAVSANDSHVLLSANGVILVSLDIQNGLKEVSVQDISSSGDDQVACVHVPSKFHGIGIVGFWGSGSISILDLTNLSNILHSEELRRKNNASVPRDIAMIQILPEESSGPTLFVAMEDGIVLTFNVDKSNYSLYGRKSVVLGTQQAQFHILPQENGLSNFFATAEHPSLVYSSEGRIVYSAVTADSAKSVCAFDNKDYPGSIIVATSDELRISHIDTQRQTHVKTSKKGQTVRRVAHSPHERAFGIACVKRELIEGQEIITSTFSLVEDMTFVELGAPFLLSEEDEPEMIECIIRAQLPTFYGDNLPAERFIVGTSLLDDENEERDGKGRILVFGVNNERTPYLVASLNLKSACKKIAVLDDNKIVAALNKTVVVYEYTETNAEAAAFKKLATFRTATVPIDIAVTGNVIAVADLMKSVSLVEYTPGQGGLPDKLEEIARHQQAVWATAVVDIEPNIYLESDHDLNLLVLRHNPDGVTREDKKRMEVIGEMNLGEMVNKIQKIHVEPTPSAMVIPQAFLATTEGSIYLFGTILPSYQDLLMRLQAKMSRTLLGLGELDFNTYRGFKNTERETGEPFRFIDGELIERFLLEDEDVQEDICKGLGPSAEEMRNIVEELRRMH